MFHFAIGIVVVDLPPTTFVSGTTTGPFEPQTPLRLREGCLAVGGSPLTEIATTIAPLTACATAQPDSPEPPTAFITTPLQAGIIIILSAAGAAPAVPSASAPIMAETIIAFIDSLSGI